MQNFDRDYTHSLYVMPPRGQAEVSQPAIAPESQAAQSSVAKDQSAKQGEVNDRDFSFSFHVMPERTTR